MSMPVVPNDLIKYAAESTLPDGRYSYTLADLMRVVRENGDSDSGALPLDEVNRVSMEFGRIREAHQHLTASQGRRAE